MRDGLDEYRRSLLGAPDVLTERCAVCGRPATDAHHVVPKGMGGMPRGLERLVPRVRLCGMGNASGCHGMAHKGILHLAWDGEGWLYLVTREPVADAEAWRTRREDYRPLPGWQEMLLWGEAGKGRG